VLLKGGRFSIQSVKKGKYRMTRSLTTFLALLGLTAALLSRSPTQAGDRQEIEKAASLWMRQKLSASQNILAGSTKADFRAMEQNAQSMLAVGYLEKWVRAGTPGYLMLVKEFDSANRALTRAAREKNLDCATIAYVQLTFSCVNCHKIVRDAGK
jgi:hypothetical protein